jgi:hypothetical protein
MIIILSFNFIYSLESKIIEIIEDSKDIYIAKVSAEAAIGDGMTLEDAKRSAIRQAKRVVLESAGVYLKGSSTVKNFQLVDDQLSSSYAGMVKVEPITSRVVSEGKYNGVYIEVKAIVDRSYKPEKEDKLSEAKIESKKSGSKKLDSQECKGYKFDVVECSYDEESKYVRLKLSVSALKKDRRISLSTTKPSSTDLGRVYLKKIISPQNVAKPSSKLVEAISEDFPVTFEYCYMARSGKPKFISPLITFQPYLGASEESVKFKKVKVQ